MRRATEMSCIHAGVAKVQEGLVKFPMTLLAIFQ